MEVGRKEESDDFAGDELVAYAIQPDGHVTNPNHLLSIAHMLGRRDPLTELQQKILTFAISLIPKGEETKAVPTVCRMQMDDFVKICSSKQEQEAASFISEIEKIAKKGLWLYDKESQRLTRTQWFQAIEYTQTEIVFYFTDKIAGLIASLDSNDIEWKLVKGIQYKGKHTRAVFNIIWPLRDTGTNECSIPELMKKLSLEHTRYSYGQLKLRVLEPSLQEIYDWDEAIFVRFGPTFSGRRVEGVWFEVITGEEARKMRIKEPEFKFALPEEKSAKI